MIKKKEELNRGIEIDLTGPQGNAFFLLGTAQKLGKQLGWDQVQIDELINDMMTSDYEHLVQSFDETFGEFVTLLR